MTDKQFEIIEKLQTINIKTVVELWNRVCYITDCQENLIYDLYDEITYGKFSEIPIKEFYNRFYIHDAGYIDFNFNDTFMWVDDNDEFHSGNTLKDLSIITNNMAAFVECIEKNDLTRF